MEYGAFRERVFSGIRTQAQSRELRITKEESFYNSDIYKISDNERAIVLSLTERYRQYMLGILSVQDLVNDTLLWFKGSDELRKSFLDKGWVLRNSRLKLFNREKYKYVLEEVVNKEVKNTEFNLVCTLTSGVTSIDSNMLITYEVLDGLGLTEDELLTIAVKNMLCKDEQLSLCGDGYLVIEDKAQAFIPERLNSIFNGTMYILPCKQLKLRAGGEVDQVLEDFKRFKEEEEMYFFEEEGYLKDTGIGTQVVQYKAGEFKGYLGG